MAEQTWTLGSLLAWTAKHLADKSVESPRLDAEILLAHAAGCSRTDLYGFRFAELASPEIRQTYRQLIGKRLEGCPVAYLVGKKEFYQLELEVSPAVLIPRPDSELVVIECLKLARPPRAPARSASEALKIVDVGTGSGNLAIAVAKHLPAAQVTAIDVSADALAVARKNALKHGVLERIRFLQGDLFGPLAAEERFDFIISNPPYIPSGDIAGLPIGVRAYEPHLALDGGGDGFGVFDRLALEGSGRLVEGGYLLIEIGAPQEGHGRERLGRIAELQMLPTIYDFSRHPRVLAARRRDAATGTIGLAST